MRRCGSISQFARGNCERRSQSGTDAQNAGSGARSQNVMGFLAPWFLAGAVAVGLPLWIHLLKRHRTDPRLFPSLMLFEKREQSSIKHRRLEHLLLFALRVAMLLLLALLFA